MEEVKITKEQFDKVNKLQYELEKKFNYISKEIICGKYEISPGTTFFTYKDSQHYYLVFEGEKILSSKIKPFSVLDRKEQIKGEQHEFYRRFY